MPAPDSNLSTLDRIRIKVRRLTRNPSQAQLSNADIDDYINNFVLYSLPAHMKLGTLETVLTFFTKPNVDTYETNTTDADDPLYNFSNIYTNVLEPLYIDGTRSFFYQTLEDFYNAYPRNYTSIELGTGDGGSTNFTGGFDSYPILQNSITVSSVNTIGDPLLATDNGDGEFTGDADPLSSISYATGQVYISFTSAPASGETIWLSGISYEASKPIAMLFFQNQFVLRPVPDRAYRVEVKVYRRPTQFINSTDVPELSEWWEYIAIGASIKILQDRLDAQGVNLLIPMFDEQELLIGRRKIIQNAGRRTETIYSGGE